MSETRIPEGSFFLIRVGFFQRAKRVKKENEVKKTNPREQNIEENYSLISNLITSLYFHHAIFIIPFFSLFIK